MKYVVAVTAVRSKRDARRIAHIILNERLAACVNILPVESMYMWDGKLKEEKEQLLFCKTEAGKYPLLEQRIIEVHPYAIPAIYALPSSAGSKEYLKWVSCALKEKT